MFLIIKIVLIATFLLNNVDTITVSCERADVEYYNTDFIKYSDATCFPYNRTLRFFNMTIHLRTQPVPDSWILLKPYILIGNRYVLTGMQTNINLKSFFHFQYFGYNDILKSHMLPPITKWPIPIENYKIFNFYVTANIPGNYPTGRYRMRHVFKQNNFITIVLNYYAKVN